MTQSNSKHTEKLMKISLLPAFLATSLALNFANAQICTPNLTAEQAYLAITGKQNPIYPPQGGQANAVTTLPKLININTASEAELTQLDGIGAKKAQDIILYRQMIAPFSRIEDLDNVKGIGKATIEKNRNRMTVR